MDEQVEVEFETNPELEMKLRKREDATHETTSEIVAAALATFLSSMGL